MADRGMKALLLDEETQGPSDRPMRLVRADDAGAPPSGAGAGSRDAASASARRGGASTMASSAPPRSSTPTRSTPAGGPPGNGGGPPAQGGPRGGHGNGGGGGAPSSAPPRSPTPTPTPTRGTQGGVVPGLGHVHPSHAGASVGLVHGVSHHALANPHGDPRLHHLAHAAQQDPARWGADLLLRGHNPRHYQELARAGRLPSHVWAHHEGRGRLGEHLRAVEARHGEELRRLYGHRPIGERALLGLAAASSAQAAVARALDAMRVHHHYPARASFGRLMHGFGQQEVARIASAFLVPGRGPGYVLAEYRALRERIERAHIHRRRALLRRLRAQWAGRGVTLVPMFASVTQGYSPAQIQRLRWELARNGDIEATFEAIEQANIQARLASAEAAFRRWQAEWEASRQAGAQTPLQEPQTVFLTTVAPPRPTVVIAPPAVVAEADEPDESEAEPVEDAAPDSSRQLVLQGAADEGETSEEDAAPEAPEAPPEGDEAGDVRALRAPAPGAHAADGVLPWHHLTQGFRPGDEAELGRAWNEGRPWDAYHAILERTAQETTARREAAFCRCMEALGCAIHGPCQLPREQLGALAHLGAHFAPEQWARLAAALTEGADDPLEVWRAIERENVAEAVAVREPAFLRHLSACGDAPERWNPAEWRQWAPHLRRAVQDGEAAGLHEELDGALGGGEAGDGGEDAGALDATFGDDAGDDAGDLGSTLGGLTTSALGLGGPGGDLGGKLATFARQAVGALQGTLPGQSAAPLGDLGRAVAGWGREASGPLDDVSGAFNDDDAGGGHSVFGSLDEAFKDAGVKDAGDAGANFDMLGEGGDLGALGNLLGGAAAPPPELERVLAPWGNNPLGHSMVRALLGLRLPDVAMAPPSTLLPLIPKPFPSLNTDPNGWWRALTVAQGLDKAAEKALRATIDAEGQLRLGIERTIVAYQRLLQGPSDELRARREALFKLLLRAAQNVAGPAFDPAQLPGGDPFVLLAQHVGMWREVQEAILTGNNPLGAFRRAEAERQDTALHTEAPARMAAMLKALWAARQAASWVPSIDAGDPGEANDPSEAGDAGDAGAPWDHRGPGRGGFHHEPWRAGFHHEPWRAGFHHAPGHGMFRDDYRPRPLYHLSFGRPMSHRELGGLLRVVPSLQAHPEGVLRDMAGLSSQALDVRGVDATTGEYLLTPGETFADIAYKLVGDRARWRELEATNPLRAEGDVRVRLPPGWFGYVPYAIPRHHHRHNLAGKVAGAILGGPLFLLAGLFRHHHHPHHNPPARFLGPLAGRWFAHRFYRRGFGTGHLFAHQHHHHRGFGPVAGHSFGQHHGGFGFGAGHSFGQHHGGFRPGVGHGGAYPQHHGGSGPGAGRVVAHPHVAQPHVAHPHRGRDTAGPEEVSGEEIDEAGSMRGGGARHGGGARRGHGGHGGHWRGGRGFRGGGSLVVLENELDEDAEDTSEARRYTVTRDDASGPLSPRFTREVAEKIAGQIHGLYDGREWLRPDWWAELRDVNPQKPLDSKGWWRDIHEGETLWIPGYWPRPESESLSDADAAEAGGPLDFLSGLNPFGSGVLAEKVAAKHPNVDAPSAAPEPDYAAVPDLWNPANFRGVVKSDRAPRRNLTTRTYVVRRGDSPHTIAQGWGAATRPHWLTELERANPHKPVDPGIGNWFSLNPGETINLPDAWGAGSAETGDVEDEAAGPDADWHSLAEMEAQAPYVAPLAKYFRGTPDPEGSWRGYGNTLAPHFEAVAPGEALSAVLELSAQGFYVALPGASGPVGWRKATTAELNHFQPDAFRQLGGLTFWVEPTFGIEPPPPPNKGETGEVDTGALTDRENLTQQTYAVHRGDSMIAIAKRFGAANRSHWFAELRDANPSKPMAVDPKTGKRIGWQTLNPGEIVNIPDVWAVAESPHARPAPGGSPSASPYLGLPTFPALPDHGAYPSPTAPPGTTPAAATVDPGTILRVQGILVAFRHAHPAEMNPANFGEGLPVSPDCLGVLTPRTQQALASFQTWTNKQGRYPMDERQRLRTDGVLDPATIAALDSFSAQALGGLAQRPPVTLIPGGLPPGQVDPALRSVIGAATTAVDDLARQDQWADVFRASSPSAGPALPPRKPGVRAPLHELPDVLDRNGAPGVPSLPPGAPHGPRRPRRPRPEGPTTTATLQVPPEVYDRFTPLATRLPEEAPPARAREEKPPAKARKDDDGVFLPMALAGLSLFSGIL